MYYSAVYGGLDIHGRQRSPVQTTLSETAAAGADVIKVMQTVDWQVSSRIKTNAFKRHLDN